MAEAKESKSNTKIEPEAAAPKPTPVVLTAAQIISADIDALNNFDKVKESLFVLIHLYHRLILIRIPNSSINYGFSVKDTELGIRITRHLKILKVLATFSDVRALYSGFLNETAPGAIQSAAETTPEFTFDRSLAISKPSRIYVHTLALLLLKKQKHFQEVDQTVLHQCVPLSVAVLEQVSQSEVWYLDSLWGFIYGLYARIHELNNQLQHVRVRLFEIYRLSTVSKRETSQAVLLNLILRCFIVSNDFAGASEFINQTMFPEGRINNEFVKYLYYTAFIKAIELDYHDAHARVGQALRKAPEKAAVGFKLAAQKLSIVVEMLLGEVPSRNLFTEGELSGYLFPYYELVRTLVKGDVAAFDKACSKNRATFEKDGLLVLINRLTLNVIRAGLKKIHLSYSRISFADIAIKLSLPATTDVENLISKAIRDQVLTGTIDVHKQELIMNDNNDTYGTSIPQLNYQKRIDFCTMIINNCSKALAQEPTKKKNKDASDMDEFEKLLAEFEDPFF